MTLMCLQKICLNPVIVPRRERHYIWRLVDTLTKVLEDLVKMDAQSMDMLIIRVFSSTAAEAEHQLSAYCGMRWTSKSLLTVPWDFGRLILSSVQPYRWRFSLFSPWTLSNQSFWRRLYIVSAECFVAGKSVLYVYMKIFRVDWPLPCSTSKAHNRLRAPRKISNVF